MIVLEEKDDWCHVLYAEVPAEEVEAYFEETYPEQAKKAEKETEAETETETESESEAESETDVKEEQKITFTEGYISAAYLTKEKVTAAAPAEAASSDWSEETYSDWYDYSSQDYEYYDDSSYEDYGSADDGSGEVNRQQYLDCDGSGHGYYEITYADGSIGYEEF